MLLVLSVRFLYYKKDYVGGKLFGCFICLDGFMGSVSDFLLGSIPFICAPVLFEVWCLVERSSAERDLLCLLNTILMYLRITYS